MIGSGMEKPEQAALGPSKHAGAKIYTQIEGQGQLGCCRKQSM